MNNLRATLRSAFFEAAFVVFGVVLALAANEWRQDVKAGEKADAALGDIIAEVEMNLALIKESEAYHESCVALLAQKIGAGETPVPRDFPQGFVKPAFVTDTAWEVAKTTGVIADMDYHTVLALSAIYDRLGHYNRQSDMIGGVIYRAIFEEGTQGIVSRPANLMTVIYTFIYREKQAGAQLEAALAELNG